MRSNFWDVCDTPLITPSFHAAPPLYNQPAFVLKALLKPLMGEKESEKGWKRDQEIDIGANYCTTSRKEAIQTGQLVM